MSMNDVPPCQLCGRGHFYGAFRVCSCGSAIFLVIRDVAINEACAMVCAECSQSGRHPHLIRPGQSIIGRFDVHARMFRRAKSA